MPICLRVHSHYRNRAITDRHRVTPRITSSYYVIECDTFYFMYALNLDDRERSGSPRGPEVPEGGEKVRHGAVSQRHHGRDRLLPGPDVWGLGPGPLLHRDGLVRLDGLRHGTTSQHRLPPDAHAGIIYIAAHF